MRASRGLPGGLGRFLPGRIGANDCRLRHIGSEKSCHGLTCRPRESSGEGFLSDLPDYLSVLVVLVLPHLMGPSSLSITHILLHVGNMTGGFPKPGHVADILITGGEDVGLEAVGNSVRVGWGFGFS